MFWYSSLSIILLIQLGTSMDNLQKKKCTLNPNAKEYVPTKKYPTASNNIHIKTAQQSTLNPNAKEYVPTKSNKKQLAISDNIKVQEKQKIQQQQDDLSGKIEKEAEVNDLFDINQYRQNANKIPSEQPESSYSRRRVFVHPLLYFSSSEKTDKLPEQIKHRCQKWEDALSAEFEEKMSKHQWTGYKLKLENINTNLLKTSEVISTIRKGQYKCGHVHKSTNLIPEQRNSFYNEFILNCPIEIRIFINDKWKNMTGIIQKKFHDGIIMIVDQKNFDFDEWNQLKGAIFDIRESINRKMFDSEQEFIKRIRNKWNKLPNYQLISMAYKCQSLPEHEPDQSVSIGEGKSLDHSQQKALAAAQNLQRPIVAIHGPPGSGKTRLLAEYLEMLRKQGKRTIVMTNSTAGYYNLIQTYCNLFNCDIADFICLSNFDEQLASMIVPNPKILKLIEENSLFTLSTEYQENADLREKMRVKKNTDKEQLDDEIEAEQLAEERRKKGHRIRDMEAKKIIDKHGILKRRIIFATVSRALINKFMKDAIKFDIFILEDAGRINELQSWWMALQLAPIIRLFGDCNQPGFTVNSPIARRLNFDKSLLQQFDDEFGAEINFHLEYQYRSNPSIQEWLNRILYKERAAKPDDSVKQITLNDFFSKGKKEKPTDLITEPFVLVDLSKLAGEWRNWMFQPKKVMSGSGRSWENWGEAFIVFAHLSRLFEHIPLKHGQISYLTLYEAQRNIIRNIFTAQRPQFSQKLSAIRMEPSQSLQGQQFEVVIKSEVTFRPWNKPYYLKYIAYEMARAKRQFIYLVNSKWLEKGSPESRELLKVFREKGRIIGPNDLLKLKPGQFEEMKDRVLKHFHERRN